jgi:CBS-domain-containing membrane protein
MGTQPAAQPRNVICGMLLSCAAGVLSRTLFGANAIAAGPMAVAGAISAMQATSTVHRELSLPLCVD